MKDKWKDFGMAVLAGAIFVSVVVGLFWGLLALS